MAPRRDIFAVPGNKHRFGLAALMTFVPQLSGASIISFYYTSMLKLVGISDAGTLLGINTGLLLFQFLVMLVACFSLPYVKRRWVVLGSWPILVAALAGLCACTAVYEKSGGSNRAASIATVAMVWVFSGVAAPSGPVFYSYPVRQCSPFCPQCCLTRFPLALRLTALARPPSQAEILSYTIRAKGMALWSVVNQCCGIFSSFVNSVGLDNIGYKYYGFYIALLPVQWVLMYVYMVETKGYTLEEIAVQFEGERAPVAQVVHHTVVADGDSDKEKYVLEA